MMKMRMAMLGLMAACSVWAADEALLPVWNMDTGAFNDFGGGYNQFAAKDSEASIHLTSEMRRGPGGKSMRIDYTKGPKGYCGVWMHLFDEQAAPDARRCLDAREYPFLSFWVRGAAGGETFLVQMADANWLKKEDSKPAGLVGKYLKGGVTTNWQEVIVPLADFGLDVSQLAGLTLNITGTGQGTVFIDDVTFKRAADTAVPESAETEAAAAEKRPLARALWVWETDRILADAEYRAGFFAFCAERGINELFLQLVYRFQNDGTEAVSCEILNAEALKAFLAGCAGRGIKAHALDGYPEFVLRDQHARVLALVKAVIEYNRTAAPEERFYGIHLDNEPYQLLGFNGPRRSEILVEFFELNEKVMALLKAKGGGLVYGIDIPFWFDEKDMEGRPETMVGYKGATKDAAKHLIDIVDNVGIMDYRSFAGGVDGIINHAAGEMEYARQAGKKIYIGVETFTYEPMPVSFVYGLPAADWNALALTEPYMAASTVGGFKVRVFNDGSNVHPGLAQPVLLADPKAFEAALLELAELYGASSGGRKANHMELIASVENALRKNPEYEGFEPLELRDEGGNLTAAGFTVTEKMLPKTTFAGKSRQDVENALVETGEFYASNPALAGFAIHHYTTFFTLPAR